MEELDTHVPELMDGNPPNDQHGLRSDNESLVDPLAIPKTRDHNSELPQPVQSTSVMSDFAIKGSVSFLLFVVAIVLLFFKRKAPRLVVLCQHVVFSSGALIALWCMGLFGGFFNSRVFKVFSAGVALATMTAHLIPHFFDHDHGHDHDCGHDHVHVHDYDHLHGHVDSHADSKSQISPNNLTMLTFALMTVILGFWGGHDHSHAEHSGGTPCGHGHEAHLDNAHSPQEQVPLIRKADTDDDNNKNTLKRIGKNERDFFFLVLEATFETLGLFKPTSYGFILSLFLHKIVDAFHVLGLKTVFGYSTTGFLIPTIYVVTPPVLGYLFITFLSLVINMKTLSSMVNGILTACFANLIYTELIPHAIESSSHSHSHAHAYGKPQTLLANEEEVAALLEVMVCAILFGTLLSSTHSH